MAVFIELVSDAFQDTFAQKVTSTSDSRRAGVDSARRPLRGLEVKDDTYAVLKLVQANGHELHLFDQSSSTGQTQSFCSFILQSVREARMEKHQIVETFGEPYIYFFGEQPRFLDIQAVLVDSFDFNWYAEWWQNYDQYLRGTRSVELGARTYLFFDDNVVEGYMLMADTQKVSEQPLMVRLTFRLFLTNYSNVTFVGDPEFPTRPSISVPADASLTASDMFSGGTSSGQFQSYQDEYTAALAAAQEGLAQTFAGFGGGQNLAQALAFGLNTAGYPNIDSVLWNAQQNQQTTGGVLTRQAPQRGLIVLNTDEFTGQPAHNTTPSTETLPGQEEPEDFPGTVIRTLGSYGAGVNSPGAYNSMGLGPNFGVLSGFGVVGTGGQSASFGVGSGTGLGGLNGGLGFVGGLTPNPVLAVAPPTQANLVNPATGVNYASGQSIFGNGVAISGGVIAGTGIGGGIPGGVGTGTGINGIPLQQFTGGTSFGAGPSGFGLSAGFIGSGGAVGASISVGGAPSAFAVAAVPGAFTPTPNPASSFFIGPDGTQSDVNTTGVTV